MKDMLLKIILRWLWRLEYHKHKWGSRKTEALENTIGKMSCFPE
jgi:hypothetical protein